MVAICEIEAVNDHSTRAAAHSATAARLTESHPFVRMRRLARGMGMLTTRREMSLGSGKDLHCGSLARGLGRSSAYNRQVGCLAVSYCPLGHLMTHNVHAGWGHGICTVEQGGGAVFCARIATGRPYQGTIRAVCRYLFLPLLDVKRDEIDVAYQRLYNRSFTLLKQGGSSSARLPIYS